MREGEEGSKENGKPPPTQLALVVHADASVVHARILGRRARPYDLGVRRALALSLATVFIFAGCGGGEAKLLSRQDYAEKADAICAEGNRRTRRLPNPGTLPQLAEVTEDTINILDDAIDELRKLRPPSDDGYTITGWPGFSRGCSIRSSTFTRW